MNNLYIHQLETENKQLREQLHIERAKIQQAIEYIKKYGTESENEINYVKYNDKDYCICASDFGEGAELILAILGDKE